MARFTGFIGPTYKLKSLNADCQRCINLYPELNESGSGKDQEIASLVSTPGLQALVTIGSGPIRGIYRTSTNALYAVSGNQLFKISTAWAATLIGTLSTSTGKVSIADNGINLVIVDGQFGYSVLLATDAFAIISDPNFFAASQVTYQDGYFIFVRTNTGQFFISGLNAVTFNATDLASSEGNPDNIISAISVHRDLWLFNERTTEVFFNTGDANLPFQRVQGAFIEKGCIAKDSVAKINNSVFWLGQDESGSGIVYLANGYQPQRISTHAVEQAIQGYTMASASSFTYQENGHHFYCLNFIDSKSTWVFDTSTNLWHERCYFNNGRYERARAENHAYFNGTHVVGDYALGKLYSLSSSVYSDDGNPIPRRRITPHLTASGAMRFYSKFQLDIESGTGLDGITQGTDPQAMLKFSDDGGHTWSNEKWTSTGRIGQTKKRAVFRRLGSAMDRVFDITITDPVSVTILGANLDFEEAANDG